MYHVSLGLLRKKPYLHSHLLQLLLAVGLLRWTAPPEPWSPLYISNYPSSFRGSLDALQSAPWETYASRASLIHPKALQQDDGYFDLETFCDYDRLARAASRRPLIAYLAEDGAPSRAPHASAGSTAVEECQTEALSSEDADLIEILWKQDVDLGIPLEDYRPCSTPTTQAVAGASPPSKFLEGSTIVPALEKLESKKDFEPSTNEPRVTSIDSETGEPIFEPVAGPSTLDGVLNNNASSDSFPDINALMGVVNEELFCADAEWPHMPGYSGASSPPFNGTDPFGGVLLQNVSMPSSFDASVSAANSTVQHSSAGVPGFAAAPTAAASSIGDPLGGITGCGELTKPTVTDQHAIRDLFTYNTSTQGSWDNFDLFHEDLAALAPNTTNATNSHRLTAGTNHVSVIVRTQDYLGKRAETHDYHKRWWKRRKLDKYYDYESEGSSFCGSGSESDSENNRLVPFGHPAISIPAARVNSTPENGASVPPKHTAIGDGGYAASDTGVSSMYSDEANEEWMESSSETSHDHDQEQLVSTDISYHSNSSSMSFGSAEGCAVPQKKYNFFGRKPYQQGQVSNGTAELSEENHVVPQRLKIAHNSAIDGFLHNHSYGQEQLSAGFNVPQLPGGVKVEQIASDPRKERSVSQADGYASSDPSDFGAGYIQVTSAKDERRARELKIPIPTEEIVTLSIDEFNERLARYELTEDQHALIRDIRRRGKNKVAAQNCRKRKLDQISALQGEVENFHDTCRSLQNENDELTRREAFAQQRLNQLRDVIANAANSGAIPKHQGHQRMTNSE